MKTTTATHRLPASLTRARLELDGSHTTEPLTEAVRRGEKLRLRRGVYVDPAVWCGAYPWDRHLLAAAAQGLWHPTSVFCRETALALHGVQQLRTPSDVHVRTSRRQQVGRHRGAPLVGRAPSAVVERILAQHVGPEGRALSHRDLIGVGTRRVLTPEPLPGSCEIPVDHTAERVRVEVLEAAVADTVPRAGLDEAVVTLDAVRAGRHGQRAPMVREDFVPWESLLPSARASRRWERAWALSDPRAESVGESLSRVRMVEEGLLLPELQAEFDLPRGGRARVDFWWPTLGLVGEFDGKMKYTRARRLSGLDAAEVVFDEKVREDQLRSLGLGVVRWCWPEAWQEHVLGRILRAAGVPPE
ncbi:hypothetical protein [Nesterenkonia suensis]